jgi:hypothetical protein
LHERFLDQPGAVFRAGHIKRGFPAKALLGATQPVHCLVLIAKGSLGLRNDLGKADRLVRLVD